MKHSVFIGLLLFFTGQYYCIGQSVYEVESDKQKNFFGEIIVGAKDSTTFVNAVEARIRHLKEKGYILATLDSVVSMQDTLVARVFIGKKYIYGTIHMDDQTSRILESSGISVNQWKDKPLQSKILVDITESVLTGLENSGYPFAKISLKNSRFDHGKMTADLQLDRGTLIRFASLQISGYDAVSKKFLAHYLDIHEGDVFSLKKYKNINRRIKNLPFMALDTIPILKFENERAVVSLRLKEQNASNFDFLIGVLPSNASGQRRFIITGDFFTSMYNKLGQGEFFKLRYSQLKPENREIDIQANYPYLGSYPLGLDGGFHLFKNGTSNIDVDYHFGVLYHPGGENHIKAFWKHSSSRLIQVDTSTLINNRHLPKSLDVIFDGGQLSHSISRLNYLPNPTSGWQISSDLTIGRKKILPNATILSIHTDGLDFEKAFDTLQLSSFQSSLAFDAAYYYSPYRTGVVKFSISGAYIYNESGIYDNELYRLGGAQDIRGFDDQSIRTDGYLFSTIEARLLLGRDSYLSLPFIDYGYVRLKDDHDKIIYDPTLGLGIGISFSTTAGIFNVSFATGKRLGNPLDFGNTKVHFGYVNRF